jgi:hypothetical protein
MKVIGKIDKDGNIWDGDPEVDGWHIGTGFGIMAIMSFIFHWLLDKDATYWALLAPIGLFIFACAINRVCDRGPNRYKDPLWMTLMIIGCCLLLWLPLSLVGLCLEWPDWTMIWMWFF